MLYNIRFCVFRNSRCPTDINWKDETRNRREPNEVIVVNEIGEIAGEKNVTSFKNVKRLVVQNRINFEDHRVRAAVDTKKTVVASIHVSYERSRF